MAARDTAEKPWLRWAILAIACIGVVLASIQTNALIVAFPVLLVETQSDLATILWVLLVVMLVVACVTPLAGKLGDLMGQARIYNFGLWVFTLSSLLAGFSTSSNHGHDLLAYRGLMGVGAAFLFVNSNAIITSAFAPYRQVGLAQGLFQVASSVGGIMGPVVGGGLAKSDWRWIFWSCFIPGCVCSIVSLFVVRDRAAPPPLPPAKEAPALVDSAPALDSAVIKVEPGSGTPPATAAVPDTPGAATPAPLLTHEKAAARGGIVAGAPTVEEAAAAGPRWLRAVRLFDFSGALLLTAFLLLTLLAMTQAVASDPTISATPALASIIAVGVVALGAFVVNEAWVTDPLVPLEIFRNRTFTMTTLAAFGMFYARGCVTFATIFFLQGPQGQDPLAAGLQLIPLGVGIFLSGMAAGRLSDRIGARNLCLVGPAVAIAGEAGLAMCERSTPYPAVAAALLVCGLGQGLFFAPNSLAGMMCVPAKWRGVAAAVRTVAMMYSQMVGVVVVFAFVLNSMSQEDLIILFVYGGGNLSDEAVSSVIHALRNGYWITLAVCVCVVAASWFAGDWKMPGHAAAATGAAAAAPAVASTAVSVAAASPTESTSSAEAEVGLDGSNRAALVADTPAISALPSPVVALGTAAAVYLEATASGATPGTDQHSRDMPTLPVGIEDADGASRAVRADSTDSVAEYEAQAEPGAA